MAVNMFLKLDGIDGECTDGGHLKWIQIEGYDHNVSRSYSAPSSSGGRSSGVAEFGDLVVSKTIDLSTPTLYLFCCNAKHIKELILECCIAAEEQHVLMRYTLSDVIVTSMSPSSSSGLEEKPGEQVTFAYGKIVWDYTGIKSDGKAGDNNKKGWNLETNTVE